MCRRRSAWNLRLKEQAPVVSLVVSSAASMVGERTRLVLLEWKRKSDVVRRLWGKFERRRTRRRLRRPFNDAAMGWVGSGCETN